MPFEVRHESRGYLSLLGQAAQELGAREQKAKAREEARRDKELALREQQLANQMEQFYASLAAEQERQQMANQNALQLQQLRNQPDLAAIQARYGGFAPQGRSSAPPLEFTPQQRREASRIRDAIQAIINAPNLRPKERQQLIQDQMNRLQNILPMPDITKNMEQASPIQEAVQERVMPLPDGSGWFVLNGDKLDFVENKPVMPVSDKAKILEVIKDLLTTGGSGDTPEKKPSAQEVISVFNQWFPNTPLDPLPSNPTLSEFLGSQSQGPPFQGPVLPIQMGSPPPMAQPPQPQSTQDNTLTRNNAPAQAPDTPVAQSEGIVSKPADKKRQATLREKVRQEWKKWWDRLQIANKKRDGKSFREAYEKLIALKQAYGEFLQ